MTWHTPETKRASSAPVMHPVTSRTIASVGHDGAALFVAFKSGGTYRYAGVPATLFHALKGAQSVGTHFAQHIKDKFRHAKV